jgi:hypothetical protein
MQPINTVVLRLGIFKDLLAVLSAAACAQTWTPLGPDDSNWPSSGAASYSSIAVGSDGAPCVASSDGTRGDRATAMKFSGGTWTPLGAPGFSAGEAASIGIAVDGGGDVFVAYRDVANGNRATVMTYNGASWTTVGSAGFSAGGALRTSIVLDSSGRPYVSYRDLGNSSKATVTRFDGSTWSVVGSAGLSGGEANYPSLALAAGDTPVLAYVSGGAYARECVTIRSADVMHPGWNLFALPLKQNDMSPSGVFGDDPVSSMVCWQYAPGPGYSAPDTLVMGRGYWMYQTDTVAVDAEGSGVDSATVTLRAGWNLIGYPFHQPGYWTSCASFDSAGVRLGFSAAASSDWIMNTMYSFNGVGYAASNDTARVWTGYWHFAIRDSLTLIWRNRGFSAVPARVTTPGRETPITERQDSDDGGAGAIRFYASGLPRGLDLNRLQSEGSMPMRRMTLPR